MRENAFDNIDKKLLENKGKIIHQIWYNFKNPDEEQPIPDKYKKLRESWKINNPEWTHILWHDKMGDWLVYKHYPNFWETYSNYKYPIQRVDAIRLCILHRYGGIYADTDTECFKPINSLIESTKKNIAFGRCFNLLKIKKTKLSNYFMYSKPNENFWLNAIQGAISYGTCHNSIWYYTCIFNSAGPKRLQKTSLSFKNDMIIFDPRDVGTMTQKQIQKNPDIVDSLFVLHKNYNEWVSNDYFYYFGFSILIIVLFVVLAMIISVKEIKRNYDNYNQITK